MIPVVEASSRHSTAAAGSHHSGKIRAKIEVVMKQPSQSVSAPLGRVRLALAAIVVCGLFVALVIYLPDIRASLQHTRSQKRSSPRLALASPERSGQAGFGLSGGQADSTLPAVAASGNSVRQVIVPRIKTVHVLPATEYELGAAHDQARGEACEPIPGGEPREISSFAPYLTQRDYREFGDGNVPSLSTRQHLFSVGFDMLEFDRRQLPRVSGVFITRYLNVQYITLQARIQKDLVSEVLHLHHRPLAAVGSFRQRRLTQEPTETLARSLQNYRSLGLFLADGMPALPENLRTLVLLHKSEKDAGAGLSQPAMKYEFVFVRALDEPEGAAGRLKCHTFATSDERTVLHFLQPGSDPSRPESCSVKTMLHFTEYADHGLRPVASISRGSIFNDQATYPMESLNLYAQSQGWKGGAIDNLTKTLDAIIDGKIPSQH